MYKHIYAHTGDYLYEVMRNLGYSDAKDILFSGSPPVFLDNERIYYSDQRIDFVMRHEKDRLYDRLRNKFILKHYSFLRIGGSYDPDNDKYGEKYYIYRIGAVEDKVEMF